MPKIERVELYHISIPFDFAFYPTWILGYPQRENRFTLIKIFTSDGIEGVSAGPAFSREREGLGSVLGPYLIDMKSNDLDTLRARLRELSYLGLRNPWIEPAFWDISGKEKGMPLYRIINEGKERVDNVQIYSSTGEIKALEERIKYCEEVLERGVKAVKLRVKSDRFEEDVELIKGVADEFKGKLKLIVDANQGWPVSIIKKPPLWDYERAIRFAKVCADFGVEWLEEPLDMDDYENLSRLKKNSPVKIAGAELARGWRELKVLLEKDCFHIYQPDATLCGGITDSVKLMKECNKRGLGFSPHTWTNGIGFLINLHIHAANPDKLLLEYPYEPPGFIPEKRDGILEEPIRIEKGGVVSVPQSPGTGVSLSKKALRKYGKRFYLGTKFRVAISLIKEKGLKEALELKRIRESNP